MYFTYDFQVNYVDNTEKCDNIMNRIFNYKKNLFHKKIAEFISSHDTGNYVISGVKSDQLITMLKKLFNCFDQYDGYTIHHFSKTFTITPIHKNPDITCDYESNEIFDLDINELFSWIIQELKSKSKSIISEFVNNCILFDVSYPGIYGQHLYNYYLDWCKLKNIIPISNTKFGLEFTKIYSRHGFIKKQTSPVLYVGIKKI